jgi:crossover junction endodeoxyribonuclease RuvC
MIVLGVDPGFLIAGYSIMKYEDGKILLIDYGYLPLDRKQSIVDRLFSFYNFFFAKIIEFQVTHLALETPFLGKNAQNFLKLGYLRGALYLLCAHYKLQLLEFSPREIKMKLTGYGAADKMQVARCIKLFFPALVSNKFDITDAIAISLCSLWKQSSPLSLFISRKF